MAGEDLQVVVSVVLNDQLTEGAQAIPAELEKLATASNAALSKIADTNPFAALSEGAAGLDVSLATVSEAATVVRDQLRLAAEAAQSLAATGATPRIEGVQDAQRVVAALQQQLTLRRELLATGLAPGVSPSGKFLQGVAEDGTRTNTPISRQRAQELLDIAQQELVLGQERLQQLTSQVTATKVLNRELEGGLSSREREAQLVGQITAETNALAVAQERAGRSAQDRLLTQGLNKGASVEQLATTFQVPVERVAALKQELLEAKAAAGDLNAQFEIGEQRLAAERAAAAREAGTPAQSLSQFSGANARQQAKAEADARNFEADRLRARIADGSIEGKDEVKQAQEQINLLRTQATEINSALRASESALAETRTADTAVLERETLVTELLASAEGRLLERTLAVAKAQISLAEVRGNPEASVQQRISAEERLLTTTRLLNAEQEKQNALVAEGAAGGGRGGGFFAGLGEGASGGRGGDSTSAFGLGKQFAEIGKYIYVYEAFLKTVEFIKDAIKQTFEFEGAVTNLNFLLGTTRDNARDVANGFGDIAAKGGLSPAQGVDLATQTARAFQGQADPTTLGTIGAQVGTEFGVLTGKDPSQGLTDTIAVVKGFNLTFQDTQRVLDVATSAAQNFGFANANAILPGLGQIGDVAKQAGFSLEETANLIGLISQTNSEPSTAAAGELRRVFGREGNQAFQNVFANFGVSTTLPFQQEVEQLSKKFGTLTDSAKAFIVGQFGGGRAGTAALALLQEYATLQDNTNKTLKDGGAAQDQFNQKLKDVEGLIKTLSGDFKNLGKDLGESGLGAIFGVALQAADPLLKTLDAIVKAFNAIPSGIRDVGFLGAELGGAAFGISKFRNRGGGEEAGAGAGAEVAATGEELAAAVARVAALVNEEAALLESGAAATTTAVSSITAAFEAGAISAEDAFILFDSVITEGAAGIAAAEALVAEALVAGTAGLEAADIELAAAIAATAEAYAASTPEAIASINAFTAAAIAAAERLSIIIPGTNGGKGFLSGGALGIGITAAIGAVLVDQAFNAANKSIAAENKGVNDAASAGQGARTSEALRAQAEKLTADAKEIAASNGGFFGSLTRGFESLFSGGTNSNTVKGDDTAAAARLQAQADVLDKLAKQAAVSSNPNDLSGLIDLTKPGGVTAGLKTLADSGRDAKTQLDTLIQAIKNLANASGAAAGAVSGEINQRTKAQETTNFFENTVASDAAIRKETFDTSGFLGLGKDDKAGRDAQILGRLGGDLAPTLNSDIQAFLASGGKLDAEGKKKLIALLEADAKGYKDFGQLTQQSQKNTLADIVQAVQNLTQGVATSANLDPATINAAVGQSADAAIKLAQGASQIAGVSAGLGKPGSDPNGVGQKLVADQANVDQLKAARSALQDLIKTGFSSVVDPAQRAANIANAGNELEQLNNSIDAATLTLNTDTVAALQVALALKNAKTPAEDKAQLDLNKLNELKRARDLTTDQGQLKIIQAEIDNQQGIVNRDALAATQSQALSKIDPANTLAVEAQALKGLEAKRDFFISIGQNKDQAFLDLQTQITAAKEKLALDTAKQVDAIAAAKVDPRDEIAVAAAKLKADQVLQQATPAGDPVATAQAAAAVAADQFALNAARVARANLQGAANVRAGDPLADAQEKFREATETLKADDKNSDKYYSDLAALNAAKLALADAEANRAKQDAELAGDTTDPVAQARAVLDGAIAKQADEAKRKVGDPGANKLNVEKAQQGVAQALFDQQFSDNQTAFNLREESAAQYLQFLKAQDTSLRKQLAAMKKGSEGYRQLVDDLNKVDQAIQAANSQLAGQFNLGDIKLPTVYEVRRSVAASANGQNVTSSNVQNIQTTINGADFAKVVAYINSVLTPSSQTVAQTGRKVA